MPQYSDKQLELELWNFIRGSNELSVVKSQHITKTLIDKMHKQVYSPEAAIKLWLYLVNSAAKDYSQKYGDNSPVFTQPIRVRVAAKLAKDFEQKVSHEGSSEEGLSDDFLSELAGAGVGVGVVGQGAGKDGSEETAGASEPAAPEKEQSTSSPIAGPVTPSASSSAGSDDKASVGGGSSKGLTFIESRKREALITKKKSVTTMKVTKTQLQEMVAKAVRKKLSEAAYNQNRPSAYSIYKQSGSDDARRAMMDQSQFLAMKLAQAGYTPDNAASLIASFKHDVMANAQAEVGHFEQLLKSSLAIGQQEWQQHSKKKLGK